MSLSTLVSYDAPSVPLAYPAAPTDTVLMLPVGGDVALGRARLVTILGNEHAIVTGAGTFTRPTTTVTAAIGAGDVAITVGSTERFYADPGHNLEEAITTGGESMVVTRVLGATTLAVRRTAPVAHASGGTVAWANPTLPTLTVQRGNPATAAGRWDLVTRVYTPDTVRSPAGLRLTTSGTYTPDVRNKYHFLTLGADTTIARPVHTRLEPMLGDELRFIITQGSTARALAWATVFNLLGYTAPARNSTNSVSFAYNGTGTSTTGAWVRIQ